MLLTIGEMQDTMSARLPSRRIRSSVSHNLATRSVLMTVAHELRSTPGSNCCAHLFM